MSAHTQRAHPLLCPCCAARKSPTGGTWWLWHCTGSGKAKMCGWITCATCQARISIRHRTHITSDPDEGEHDSLCSNPQNLTNEKDHNDA